jgi:hypothetical protein
VANRAYTWKSELRKVVENNWKIGQDFTFVEVYESEPYFKELYPSNFNIRDKLYQTLQRLRDEDKIVAFIDDKGTYRRIA